MRYEYIIGARYLRARRRERFVSLIAVISLIGIALGTFALSVTLSVMSGFQEDLRNRLLAFTPQVTVERAGPQAPNTAQLGRKIQAVNGVSSAAPFVSSEVMVVSYGSQGLPRYVSAGRLRGITPATPLLTELNKSLTRGDLDSLYVAHATDVKENGKARRVSLPGAIVGDALAMDLGLRIGDPMVIVAPSSLLGGIGGPRLRRFVVTGFFHSGMYQFDSSLIFSSLKDARALLGDDPEVESGLEVRVRNLFSAPAIAHGIRAVTGRGYTVTDWTEANAPLFSALKLEKFTYFLVLLLIVLVAAFNIVATLVMVVMERRKEIAILRAMGARAGSVALIFLCEGAALGLVGTTIGVGVGLLTSFVIGKYHLIHLPPGMFMVSALPVRLYAVNFIAIAVASVVMALCAAIYPALQARAMSPVEVIRYE